jgi:hypothetical protein
MSDPAIEAAQRQAEKSRLVPGLVIPSESTHEFGVLTAREALKPLREVHRPVTVLMRRTRPVVCHTCWGSDGDYAPWPCPSAQHLYTTEELA